MLNGWSAALRRKKHCQITDVAHAFPCRSLIWLLFPVSNTSSAREQVWACCFRYVSQVQVEGTTRKAVQTTALHSSALRQRVDRNIGLSVHSSLFYCLFSISENPEGNCWYLILRNRHHVYKWLVRLAQELEIHTTETKVFSASPNVVWSNLKTYLIKSSSSVERESSVFEIFIYLTSAGQATEQSAFGNETG